MGRVPIRELIRPYDAPCADPDIINPVMDHVSGHVAAAQPDKRGGPPCY